MRMRLLVTARVLSVLSVVLLVTLPAAAHHVSHEVTRGEAVLVSLAYGDGSPMSHDRYEIIAEGEETPFQAGVTDSGGRIFFQPDQLSTWRVRVFSEDGHGADFTFQAGPAEAAPAEPEASETAVQEPVQEAIPVEKPFIERFAGPVAGVGIIFGLFGLFSLFIRKRR